MKSSFFEFHVAKSGLFTAKAGLQVVSHNISNANTPGYSRQYAELRANKPMATWNSRGMIGTGSESYGIGQVRSLYLDKKYWTERGVLGEYTSKQQKLSVVETIFNELSGTGLSSNFSQFFNTLQSLTTNAPDSTYRNDVSKAAEALTSFVNSTALSLRKQQRDTNTEVSMMVSTINNLGTQIASLNERIAKYEIDGSRANDLRDQRALLIDELSQYVNIQVSEDEMNDEYAAGKYPNPEDRGKSDKKLTVLINGYEFVNDWDVNTLKAVPRQTGQERNPMDAEGLYDIYFSNGVKFNIYSPTLKGQLKGLIDVRDGNDGAAIAGQEIHKFKGIPYYLEQLNVLVRTFAKAVNEGLSLNGNQLKDVKGHVDGYGNNSNSASNIWLFTYTDDTLGEIDYDPNDPNRKTNNYSGMTCFNFRVNSKILDEPDLLACSDAPFSGESNNNMILGFASLSNHPNLYKEGKVGDFINSIAGKLGIDLKQAKNFVTNYADVTATIDNQRMQVSGVSLNEETLSMLQYQQQFVAATKLISVINEIYDNMINRMGV